ncbi:MAG: helix-turn-helix transcriptional regulator [Thermoanaerobacterales bacterium]|nr:helix-turn-helix transcriptional regulator [Thermoanaerobacterales bacterium]
MVNLNIGRRLTEIRTMAGISANALAKKAGVAQSTISEIEAGKRQPSLSVLQKLSTALGITLADFFAPAGQGAEPLPAELRRLLEKARELTPEELAAFERMLDLVLKRPGAHT